MNTKGEENQEIQTADPAAEAVENALRRKAAQVNPHPGFVNRLANLLRKQRTQAAPARRMRLPVWAWLGTAVAAMMV